ncbi:MAG: HAD family phosphatase [Clostridia bacterium]|nr:HAD family phosphatase [Clostridia bacterium]
MKYKLFIADYDGTLGGFEGINPETVDAIKEYEKKGGKFVVCTGRMFKNIRDICSRYDIADAVSSYQGARINDRKSGKTLFAGKVPDDLAVEILNLVKDLPVKPAVLSDNKLYYCENSAYIEMYKKANIIELVRVSDLARGVADREFEALKINVICEGIGAADFIADYGERYKNRLIVNSGGPNLAEFVNPACSKGAAVRFLANYYGVGYDEIIAVGDSTNDVELIRGAWHGVAVGDAKEELKRFADEITVPYKDQPVKYLLEKYCL